MNIPFTWWANRKSRMGMMPSALPPPHLPGGKEWWTTPPTSVPQPEHLEYVAQFMTALMGRKPSRSRDMMMRYVAEWMRVARRILHEEQQAPERADLHTTDGLIVAASRALQMMRSRIYGLGGEVDEEVTEICCAVQGRAEKIRRERALESAKQRNGVNGRNDAAGAPSNNPPAMAKWR